MGQKIHPLALRIHAGFRDFDQAWYSKHFFWKLLSIDLQLRNFLQTFMKALKLPQGRLAFMHFAKSTKIYNFFCYPKYSREIAARIFQVSLGLPKKSRGFASTPGKFSKPNALRDKNLYEKLGSKVVGHPSFCLDSRKNSLETGLHGFKLPASSSLEYISSFFPKNEKEQVFPYLQSGFSKGSGPLGSQVVKSALGAELVSPKNSIDLPSCSEISQAKTLLFDWKRSEIPYKIFSSSQYVSEMKRISPGVCKLSESVETALSACGPVFTPYIPIRVTAEWQDAGFFADEIVFLLERRVSFRQIKNRLVAQAALNPHIQGLRITCSGRVGGKSKKAQRAKIESIHYGQTSLHIFASKIDYAVRTAHTALGSTGVKVWLCFN